MELTSFTFAIIFALASFSSLKAQNNFPWPCASEIYCHGPLLETIQLNKLYVDDKTFVDLPLKKTSAEVLTAFNALGINGSAPGNATVVQILKTFVADNFDVNGTEFQEWTPKDWQPNPKFLSNITDIKLKEWATTLHGFWEELGRLIKDDVKDSPEKYSMIYVSHPVIVPGGRFKEFYYWDSYWIQKGLIVSEMYETVRGMIENFFELVEMDTLGYIPNGGRIYYERTQPPLLIPMAKNYYEATKNRTFIVNNFATMQKEFEFFMTKRTVTFGHQGQNYTMARYNVDRKGPRPEAYSKDYEVVEPLNISEDEKEIMYANLKAGAESGWDFSSRWFVPAGEPGNLSHVRTRDIIPTDLNSFLYWNAVLLGEFCELINEPTTCNPTYYKEIATEWKRSIKNVLWDEVSGSWFDYDFVRHEQRKQFYPTNLAPLWVNAHHNEEAVQKVLNYFHNSGATSYPGGIPSSMLQTGEQWDFPNGWAPLNHMVVEAFEYSRNIEAQNMAFDLAQKWTRSNHKAYNVTEHMFEKYDVSIEGGLGGGGEYEVVIGFGWSNGVVLEFLKMYGDRLTSNLESDPEKEPEDDKDENKSGSTTVQIGITTIIISAFLTFRNIL